MSNSNTLRQIMRDKQLASLGDAYVNFIYSLALSKINDRPQAVKVSDRILAEAFKLADLRPYLGTRIQRKDSANACESILIEAYRRNTLSIEESVKIICENPEGPVAGLSGLVRLAVQRLGC
jgi:uncharacterized radical SAM superfamily protein